MWWIGGGDVVGCGALRSTFAEAPSPQPPAALSSAAPAGQGGKITAANLMQLDMWTKALQILKPGALMVAEPAFEVFAKRQLEEVVKYCLELYSTDSCCFLVCGIVAAPLYFILVVSPTASCCFVLCHRRCSNLFHPCCICTIVLCVLIRRSCPGHKRSRRARPRTP